MRSACNATVQAPYLYYWHAEPLGADGEDYRANFVHAPFPENQHPALLKGRAAFWSVVERLPARETDSYS